MLRRNDDVFCASYFIYHDRVPGREDEARIGIEIRGPAGQERRIAAVDTGATWSLMSRRNWSDLDLERDSCFVQRIPYHISRLGATSVDIYKTSVVLSSTEGDDLAIDDACIAVTSEWQGPIILGYTNMLDRIRFAVDPDPTERKFYFGPSEDGDQSSP